MWPWGYSVGDETQMCGPIECMTAGGHLIKTWSRRAVRNGPLEEGLVSCCPQDQSGKDKKKLSSELREHKSQAWRPESALLGTLMLAQCTDRVSEVRWGQDQIGL